MFTLWPLNMMQSLATLFGTVLRNVIDGLILVFFTANDFWLTFDVSLKGGAVDLELKPTSFAIIFIHPVVKSLIDFFIG